tara:strand:- start:190 stop:363 length:174 start_codon:yes stop_codon:yes gene_type:complete
MKQETAFRILKKRAAWYGMSNDFKGYLDMIKRCGAMTAREEAAVECLKSLAAKGELR